MAAFEIVAGGGAASAAEAGGDINCCRLGQRQVQWATGALWVLGAACIALTIYAVLQAEGSPAAPAAAIPPLTSSACPNYSPTFPSRGGPDCACPCADGTGYAGTAFHDPFPEHTSAAIVRAGELVRSIDPQNTVLTEGGASSHRLHISFAYFCCYSEAERARLRQVLSAWGGWRPHPITLSHATCAIDGPALDHVSIILMLSEESNRLMMEWAGELEDAIERAGLPVHTRRRDQEPYHTTIAVVNGTSYPVAEAIRQLNSQFPRGAWQRAPITLAKPCDAFLC